MSFASIIAAGREPQYPAPIGPEPRDDLAKQIALYHAEEAGYEKEFGAPQRAEAEAELRSLMTASLEARLNRIAQSHYLSPDEKGAAALDAVTEESKQQALLTAGRKTSAEGWRAARALRALPGMVSTPTGQFFQGVGEQVGAGTLAVARPIRKAALALGMPGKEEIPEGGKRLAAGFGRVAGGTGKLLSYSVPGAGQAMLGADIAAEILGTPEEEAQKSEALASASALRRMARAGFLDPADAERAASDVERAIAENTPGWASKAANVLMMLAGVRAGGPILRKVLPAGAVALSGIAGGPEAAVETALTLAGAHALGPVVAQPRTELAEMRVSRGKPRHAEEQVPGRTRTRMEFLATPERTVEELRGARHEEVVRERQAQAYRMLDRIKGEIRNAKRQLEIAQKAEDIGRERAARFKAAQLQGDAIRVAAEIDAMNAEKAALGPMPEAEKPSLGGAPPPPPAEAPGQAVLRRLAPERPKAAEAAPPVIAPAEKPRLAEEPPAAPPSAAEARAAGRHPAMLEVERWLAAKGHGPAAPAAGAPPTRAAEAPGVPPAPAPPQPTGVPPAETGIAARLDALRGQEDSIRAAREPAEAKLREASREAQARPDPAAKAATKEALVAYQHETLRQVNPIRKQIRALERQEAAPTLPPVPAPLPPRMPQPAPPAAEVVEKPTLAEYAAKRGQPVPPEAGAGGVTRVVWMEKGREHWHDSETAAEAQKFAEAIRTSPAKALTAEEQKSIRIVKKYRPEWAETGTKGGAYTAAGGTVPPPLAAERPRPGVAPEEPPWNATGEAIRLLDRLGVQKGIDIVKAGIKGALTRTVGRIPGAARLAGALVETPESRVAALPGGPEVISEIHGINQADRAWLEQVVGYIQEAEEAIPKDPQLRKQCYRALAGEAPFPKGLPAQGRRVLDRARANLQAHCEEGVRLGLIDPETAQAQRGTYIGQRAMEEIPETVIGRVRRWFRAGGVRITPEEAGHLKKRTWPTPAEKRAAGRTIIEDPIFQTAKPLYEMGTLLNKIRAFNSMAADPRFEGLIKDAPKSARGKNEYVDPGEAPEGFRLLKIAGQSETVTNVYLRRKAWGDLGGKFVENRTADLLEGVMVGPAQGQTMFNRVMKRVAGFMRMAKTTGNMVALASQIPQNAMSASLAGFPIIENPVGFCRAINEMWTRTGPAREFFDRSRCANADIFGERVFRQVNLSRCRSSGDVLNELLTAVEAARPTGSKIPVIRQLQAAWRFQDQTAIYWVWRNCRARRMSVPEADAYTSSYFPLAKDVPEIIRRLDEDILGIPFFRMMWRSTITNLANLGKTRGILTLLKWGGLINGWNLAMCRACGITPEEYEKRKKAAFLGGLTVLLPIGLGKEGAMAYDLAYRMPGLLTGAATLAVCGRFADARGQIYADTVGRLMSNPVMNLAIAYGSGIDPFSKREIVRRNEPLLHKAAKWGVYTAKRAAPGVLEQAFTRTGSVVMGRETLPGAILRGTTGLRELPSLEEAERFLGELPRLQRPKYSLGEALLRSP